MTVFLWLLICSGERKNNYKQNVARLGQTCVAGVAQPKSRATKLYQKLAISICCEQEVTQIRFVLAEQIVAQGEHHQRQDQAQPDGHQDAKRPVTRWFARNGFVSVEHQMPPIQRRNGE